MRRGMGSSLSEEILLPPLPGLGNLFYIVCEGLRFACPLASIRRPPQADCGHSETGLLSGFLKRKITILALARRASLRVIRSW